MLQKINYTIVLCCLLFFSMVRVKGQSSRQLVSAVEADTWAATDALGRELPGNKDTGGLKEGRYVGIFYFLWLGAHGYDSWKKPLPREGVMPKEKSDTLSPYDLSVILQENPGSPAYGPVHAFHHWGEPYFGYYLSNDEWVIMKHAQLLSDAGIDVIAFDVTNGLAYLPQVFTLCRVFSGLQQKGWQVPRIAFLANSRHVATITKIYEGFYKEKDYENLWFYWKGKPLLMGNPEGLSKEIQSFFSFRRSWAWTEGQEWFGEGKDKWPWIDHYPQNYGWHTSPEVPEQIPVAAAEHPVSNIGRSFHNGKQPGPDSFESGKGLYFKEQWERALEVDPEFVFITGWNEWVAMRFNEGKAKRMAGKPIARGDTYFVDQYSPEYSRDIEPLKGGFKDNYYYQMVSGIRRFKGTRKLNTANNPFTMTIDGEFEDWKSISSKYYDHPHDIGVRSHPGWGRIEKYENTSGRNDIVEARVAEDADFYYFYVKFREAVKSDSIPDHLQLLIQTDNEETSWMGYNFLVEKPSGVGKMLLQKSLGGWNWASETHIPAKLSKNQLELSLPKSIVKATASGIRFKWLDNTRPQGDIMRFYDKGDAAPNARFSYRYQTTLH